MDRALATGGFCQIKGVPSHLKYESDGSPGVSDLAGVLHGSVNADRDLANLLKTQLLFWMLAAPDGHAKNFSVRLLPQGRYTLTPLYDVMSIWPVKGNGPNQFSMLKAKMAMAVLGKNKHYHFNGIHRRYSNYMAIKCFGRADAEYVIHDVLQQVPTVINSMTRQIPSDLPESLAMSLIKGLRKLAENLEQMPKG